MNKVIFMPLKHLAALTEHIYILAQCVSYTTFWSIETYHIAQHSCTVTDPTD